MHCPTCGKTAIPDQQFCRSCGMSLESVSQLVAQHSSTPALQTQTKTEKAENERAVLQRMVQRIMWGMLILGIGIIFLVANKSFDLWILGLLASFFMLGGTGLAGYGVLAALRDGMTPSGGRLPSGILEADVKSLPIQPVPLPLPSVTERTTQLFTSNSPPKDTNENLRRDVSKTPE